MALALFLPLAAWVGRPTAGDPDPQAASPEEERERQVIDRFVSILEKNPRRGTALDRVYGYHVERGNLDAFIQGYVKRTRKDPTDGIAWMVLGLLESQRGKDANAVAAFRQAEKHLGDNPLPSYYLGQSLVLVGQPEAAAEAFERAITRKPGRTDLLDIFQALGRVYQRAQKSDKALAVWSRLEELFPDDQRVAEQIASTLVEEGQLDQALPRYEKLAQAARDPYQKATFRMEAAELKVRIKQTAKALKDFEDLLGELNPDSWLHREVRRKIEDVFLRNDDLAGLARYYDGWLAKNPADVDAIARLAHTLSNQGRLPESRSWLEKGIARAPSRRELRLALIEQLAWEQKYGEAAQQYEAMDKAEPNNPDTLREWGKIMLRDTARPEAERKNAAYAVWKRLLDKRPKDPVITAQVADLVRSAGMTDEAVALYRRAIELAPDAAQYREYLGEYYHSLKRRDEALAAWRPIAEGANRNAKNLARLGEVFNGFGYRAEALAAYADALKLEKEDFNLQMRYADLLRQDGRNGDALAQLDAATKLVGNAEDAEAVLQAQIQIYQTTETLEERTAALQQELAAGKKVTAERWHRLARYYEAQRQLDEATAAIGKALALDSKSIPILASAARIHESGGNLLLAADTNRKLAAIDRRFRTEYLTAVAKLEARLGRRTEALQAGRDLLAAAPGNPDHYKFFAELCFQLGEGEEGLESLRRCVRVNPSEPQGLLTLANALVERYRTGEAIELYWQAFEKTTELEGKLGIVGRLAELYLQNDQFDRLLERLERERREADKQREMTMCLAQAYHAAGDLGTARAQLERLLAENARDTQLLAQLSSLAESEGDLPLALKYQRQLTNAAPSNRDGLLRLAQLLVKAGESDEAAAIWVKLAEDESEQHRTLQAIDGLLANQKPETALAVTTRLLTQKPGDWELLYREGAALAALKRIDEAARRFQAILEMRHADDEESASLKAFKKKKPTPASLASASAQQTPFQSPYWINPLQVQIPLEQRTQNIWEIRAYTNMDPRFGFWMAAQQRTWGPRDYGQCRVAALAWLYGFAEAKDRGDAFIRAHRPERGRAGEGPRAAWDWYYLQQLRLDQRQIFEAARVLARNPDPVAQWAYLNALGGRTSSGRVFRPQGTSGRDNTPPLPPAQLDEMLARFRRLRQQKPEWLTTTVLTNVLTELKRARRSKEEEQVYRAAVAAIASATQAANVLQVLNVAGARGDLETALKLFDKLDKLQGANKRALSGPWVARQATNPLTEVMKHRADAKAHAELPRILNAYLASLRRQRQSSGRPLTANPSNAYMGYYFVWAGNIRRNIQMDFPQPNDYFDTGAIELLRNAFELYKRDDLLSDLFTNLRGQLARASAPEKVYLRLALGYMHWWNQEREQALAELTAAGELAADADANLRLELAQLRENNNEPAEALAVLDSVTPLDHTTMQRRETAALRLAVRTGNVTRAREAADRLFGLRLDAETQVQLAAQMHQLGMHDAAEKVLARAGRQAGHRTAALVSLMHQYLNQNQPDLAVQIARDLLRKATAPTLQPAYFYREPDGRSEAISVLARSGKITEMIERTEAQIKSSPNSMQLYQTLLDFYRASGDKTKLKDAAERMARVRPDDSKVRFQIGQTLQQVGENAAAATHFLAAVRKEPALFAVHFWQVQLAFDMAHRTEELVKLLDEIDLRSMGSNYWAVMNLIQPLFGQERTRAQGLKLFRKMWEAYPQERQQMLGSLAQEELWHLPEVYDYARQAIIPRGDDPVEPWRGSDQVVWWLGDGRAACVATQLLEVARRQHRLRPLTREVEQALATRPEWGTGKALMVLLDLQCGRIAEARKAWRQMLADRQNPMPLYTRLVFASELADYEALRDLALRTYESAAEEALTDLFMDFRWHPLRLLAQMYRETGRKAEARALLLRFTRPTIFDSGFTAYLRIENTVSVSNMLMQMGYPVDAVRLCTELVEDKETLQAAEEWNGPWMRQQAEQGLTGALQLLKPAALPSAVPDLLTPRADARGAREVLDLVMLVRPRELPDARLMSLMEMALRGTAKDATLRKQVRASLDKLLAEHPRDFSVLTTAALDAFVEDNPDRIAEAVGRLVRQVEASRLEDLPRSHRANARQRAEAARQLGIWLVARQCLRRPTLRGDGLKLGERAVEAARRQIEPHLALAMLREWGQFELDRGDNRAAQQCWAQMLGAIGLEAAPAVGLVQGGAREVGGTQVASLQVAPPAAVATVAVPAPAAPPAAAPSAGRGGAAVTVEQFQQAAQIARLAAQEKMLPLSLRAVRDSLRRGPPITPPQNFRRPWMIQAPQGQQLPALDDGSQSAQLVETRLAELVALWRRQGVAAADIYAALAGAVLPASRPAEVFLYSSGVNLEPGAAQHSVGHLLVEAAVRADRVDDLRRRVEARQAQPLGEMNARVLLSELARAGRDRARQEKLLAELGQRLKKDTSQRTAERVCLAAVPALAAPETAPAALAVLERAARNLGSVADQRAVDLLLLLARHDFDHGRTKEGRGRLKSAMVIVMRLLLRQGGQQNLMPQLQRIANEYVRAGLVADVLDLFGMAVDLPADQRAQIPAGTLNELTAAFYRRLADRPAKERYDLLKGWTYPALLRRSLRVLGTFVPTDTPPAAFGKFTPPPDGVFSTFDLLVGAARDAGKLDELAADAKRLADRKAENGTALYVVVQVARGQGGTTLALVRQQLDELRKKAFAPPPPQSMFRFYGGPEMNGPVLEWADVLLARACLSDPKLAEVGESMARLLIGMAEKSQNWALVTHLRSAMAARVSGAATAMNRGHWHDVSHSGPAARSGGTVPPLWVAHEGHVAHLFGPEQDYLVFDYPLTGKFEFSVDVYQGGGAEGQLGYGGFVFDPKGPPAGGQVWPVGHHEQAAMHSGVLCTEAFNRYTLQVEPGKVRFLVNGRMVHEITEVGPTSPWLTLYCGREQHTAFRNAQLRGNPKVPRELHLSHGDRLEGWVATFYGETMPNRLSKVKSIEDEDTPRKRPEDPDPFDWYARDGEIHGRLNTETRPSAAAGSRLAYFRPLRPGETLSYEFFYRPGDLMVHPCLGRLAFLLEPAGVRLHWLTDNGTTDWTGLAADNAVDAATGQVAGPVSLKANDWNQLRVSLAEGSLRLELNGMAIHEHKPAAGDDLTFGLFHYKDRTAARVRNVVLTGRWPDELTQRELTDPLAAAGPVTDGAARRTLIGDHFFLKDAGNVLRRARALPPEQTYELLMSWVLPVAGHPVFQMAGEFTPTDPAPPAAGTSLPRGRRVQTGGELEAPALELVALAKLLGKLDELARHIDKAPASQARGRWAMLALVRAAQGRDEEAAAALKELRPLVSRLQPFTPVWQRWPELVAATGTLNRPALRGEAVALLDVLIEQIEQCIAHDIPLADRDTWARRVRHARTVAQLPNSANPDTGLGPWAMVSHAAATPRGIGVPPAHWTAGDGVLTHLPGREHDYLYLRTPLRGDFEVSCELSTRRWHEAQVAYGGLRLELKANGKSFDIVSFDRRIRTGVIEPSLAKLGEWYRFRLVVHDGTAIMYVNDRKLCQEWLADDTDPWLMIHADQACTASVRNLTITGRPTVPESLALDGLPDLTGWLPYSGEQHSQSRGRFWFDQSEGAGWEKRGGEIVHRGQRRENTPGEPPPPRTYQDEALHYHRPLLEDGVIEYEFYYEPDKVQAHPLLDRLAFLLEPGGVRVHWLTDGAHDRTGLAPDNATTEPNNRRGPERLPLKPKAWNRAKLAVAGDTVTLHLNDVEVYQRALESTNQRTFGLFHYGDITDLRVRNVTYRGQWPRKK
jgi:tetratricopeptide (TPR) repeat protein